MIFNTYNGIRISAISAAVPSRILDISALGNSPGEDPKYIEDFIKNTAVTRKHVAAANQTASDFACAAVKVLEENKRYQADEIGVLINVTQTPDYRTPSTALLIHKRLGLSKNCIAFDINLGCSGFVYGVSVGASLLTTSTATKALVVMGDTLARGRIGEEKRTTNSSLLMGDASVAILLEKGDGCCIRSGLMSDGEGYNVLSRPYGAWRHPEPSDGIVADDIAVFKFAIKEVPKLIKEFTERVGCAVADYDGVFLHQANMMILKTISKRLGIPNEKCGISLDRYGNTSNASVPVTIVDRYGEDKSTREVNLLTSGFGIGLSWGVLDFEINTDHIYPMVETAAVYNDDFR